MAFETPYVRCDILTTADFRIRLVDKLRFFSEERQCWLEVPAGFESDGCSTPQQVWNILPPFGRYLPGAVGHDYYYRETWHDRKFCDDVFMEMMVSLGCSEVQRMLIYEALRVFGGIAFERDRQALEDRLKDGAASDGCNPPGCAK